MNIFQQVFAKVNPKASDLMDGGENVSPQTGRSDKMVINKRAPVKKTEIIREVTKKEEVSSIPKTSSLRIDRFNRTNVSASDSRAATLKSPSGLKSPNRGIPVRKNSPMKSDTINATVHVEQIKQTEKDSEEMKRLVEENKCLKEQIELLTVENKKIQLNCQAQLEQRDAVWTLKLEEFKLGLA